MDVISKGLLKAQWQNITAADIIGAENSMASTTAYYPSKACSFTQLLVTVANHYLDVIAYPFQICQAHTRPSASSHCLHNNGD